MLGVKLAMRKLAMVVMFIISFTNATYSKSESTLIEYDYSNILSWNYLLGYIGKGQRLYIHFNKVYKDKSNPMIYNLYGESRVKNKIRSFKGYILIKSFAAGENDYKLVDRYLLQAEYCFREDSLASDAGFFSGNLSSYFFVYNDSVYFDGLDGGADSYSNNQFRGVWVSYHSKKKVTANFGNSRIPDSGDLDIGADEFRVNNNKIARGWRSFAIYQHPESKKFQKASAEEQSDWWKMKNESPITWSTDKRSEFLSVIIYKKKEFLQTLNFKSRTRDYNITLEDFNFDGYRDVFLRVSSDSCYLYLWSQKCGCFLRDNTFDYISDYVLDQENKSLIIVNNISDRESKFSSYQYLDDHFVLVSTLTKGQSTNDFMSCEAFSSDGKRGNTMINPSYDQLPSLWKKFFLFQKIIESSYWWGVNST